MDTVLQPQILALAKDRRTGLLVVGVDSPQEGGYLVSCCLQWFKEAELPHLMVSLNDNDPFHFREILFGLGEKEGQLPSNVPGQILVLENGCVMPASVIRDGCNFTPLVSRALGGLCLLPVLQGEYQCLLDTPGVIPLQITPFPSVPANVRLEIVQAQLEQTFGSVVPETRRIWSEVILAKEPTSLTEVLNWIDDWKLAIEKFPEKDPTAEEPTRMPIIPDSLPSRTELEAAFSECNERMVELGREFASWASYPLLYEIPEPRHPFSFRCEQGWFVGAVTWLNCRITDGCDKSFKLLLQKEVQNGEVVDVKGPPFLDHLYWTRTLMQHGNPLPSDGSKPESDSIKKIESAKKWFADNCKTKDPGRRGFRILTKVLLREWDEAIQRGLTVMRVVRATPKESECLETHLISKRGELSDDEWRGTFRSVITNQGSYLEVEPFKNRYLLKARSMLLKKKALSSRRLEAAYDVAMECLFEEVARFPLTPDDFGDAVPEGRERTIAVKEGRKELEKNPYATKEELLAIVIRAYQDVVARRKPISDNADQ